MITIAPLDVSDVTGALLAMLRDAPAVGLSDVTCERSSEPPGDPGPFGWVGIYRLMQRFTPRGLSSGGSWKQSIELLLFCKVADLQSGENCEVRLERLCKAVLGVALSDTSIRGTVQMIEGDVDVRYEVAKQQGDQFTQLAVVYLTLVGFPQVLYS